MTTFGFSAVCFDSVMLMIFDFSFFASAFFSSEIFAMSFTTCFFFLIPRFFSMVIL